MAFVKRVSLVLMGCLISLSTGITVRETSDATLTGNALEIDDRSDILFSEDNSNSSTVCTNFKKVKQIELGYKCSAAITEDGCLYTWGINHVLFRLRISHYWLSIHMGNKYKRTIRNWCNDR